MRYYIEELAQVSRKAFEQEVLNWPQVTVRRMFDCPAYLADERLFAFLVTEGVVITQMRLKDKERLAEDYEIEPFHAGEREIEHWVKVTVAQSASVKLVMAFVKKSYQTALKNA